MRQFIKKKAAVPKPKVKRAVVKKIDKQYKRSNVEIILENQMRSCGLDWFVVEYTFHQGLYTAKRRWRIDAAFVEEKVLIEVQGGTYVMGRHNQGDGFADDRLKANAAQEEGWMILEYDTNHVKKGHAIEQICRIISSRTGREYLPPNIGGNDESSASSPGQVVRKPAKRKKRQSSSESKLVRKPRSTYLRSLCGDCSRKKTECICAPPR